MFYSHTFLAKKSPLGTVWIAAHLERKIKKHQLDGIDIPSYAECIMFPEVPIALRLSGHLLYGLVKIYSMKVKYLVQDCNRMVDDIRTVFTSIQVNLPVDADRAPFESVTLPNNLNLDAVELDDYQMQGPDNHLKTYDQITIQDQFPIEREQYVSISLSEDDRIDSSPQLDSINPGSGSMQEDVLPQLGGEPGDLPLPNENVVGSRDPGPRYDDVLPPFDDELGDLDTPIENVMGGRDPETNNLTDNLIQNLNESHFADEPPEVMRDAVHNSELELGDTINDLAGVHEQSVPSMNRNASLSPIMEGVSGSGEGSLPPSAHDRVPTVVLADDLNILNTEISLGHVSGQHLADVQLQPSPPVNQNARKKRKKRQFFDESIVLSNAEMKKQLDDTSKLVCKRRKLPCSALGVWRFTRSQQNEQIVHEPLLSGMCSKLQEVFKRRHPPSRSESASFEASSGHVDAPETDPVLADMDMEPERPRFETNANEIIHDPMLSSPAREESIPPIAHNFGSVSDEGKRLETEVLPTFETRATAVPFGHELAATPVNLEEQLQLDDSILRDSPRLQNSTDLEELNFLEASNASSGCDVTEVGTMSATTRKVAQYLQELSPAAHTPEDQSECISLNKILERKPRKHCARMFFETLVLKSQGLIDVQQEEAYGDILISRTPALSSFKF